MENNKQNRIPVYVNWRQQVEGLFFGDNLTDDVSNEQALPNLSKDHWTLQHT